MVTAPSSVEKNLSKVGHSQVDLFATGLNHNLPLYVSPVPDQQAWNIDVLSISRSSLVAYAYPPTALLLQVVQNGWGKSLYINVLDLKGLFLALKQLTNDYHNQTCVDFHRQFNSCSLYKKTGRKPLINVCTAVENHELVPSLQDIVTCLAHSRVPKCDADSLSRSTHIPSTEWSLKSSGVQADLSEWYTPHIDLFATHLNHKVPLYISSVPDQTWEIDALSIQNSQPRSTSLPKRINPHLHLF